MRREILILYRGNKTQSEMASLYGVTQQAWSMWERGENTPSLPIMKKLENDIGRPMEEIFFDVFNNQKLSKN